MEIKNIVLKFRTERGMSQNELADKIMVTRQANQCPPCHQFFCRVD